MLFYKAFLVIASKIKGFSGQAVYDAHWNTCP